MIAVFSGPCPFCKREAGFLEKLYQKYGPQGVEIVNVVLSDESYNTSEPLLIAASCKYRHDYGFTFVSALDQVESGGVGARTMAVPENLFVDENLCYVGKVDGAREDNISAVLDEMVK